MKVYADLQTPDAEECILRGFASSYINDAIENVEDFFRQSDDLFDST